MKRKLKIQLAFASAIVVSLLWIAGDVYLYGFELRPENYPLLSKDYAHQILDIDLSVLMLEGSSERLMFGALIAAMSAFLWIPAFWLACQLFKDGKSRYAELTFYVLTTGAVLSPLAHASIYHVGEIYKVVLHTDPSSHPYLLSTANDFVRVFKISWTSAIACLAVGWLLFMGGVFLKKTMLPKWTALFNPFMFSLALIAVSRALPPPYMGWVNGAAFNIAHLLFFLFIYISAGKKIKGRCI